MAYNFQTAKNKIKLLTEYENETQNLQIVICGIPNCKYTGLVDF
jgi:hypothetical protein